MVIDVSTTIEKPSNGEQQTPGSNGVSGPSLRKVLGVTDGIAIVIGICIGGGIYKTPQDIAGHLSSFTTIILLWIGVGIFVFISGLIYAELGTRMPKTGGEYVYITRCFGPFAGFIFGWGQLFIVRTSASAGLALIVAYYLNNFIPLDAISQKIADLSIAEYLGYIMPLEESAFIITALLVIFLFGVLNYIGIKKASLYQKISTVLKVFGLLFIIIVGIFFSGGYENLLSTRAAPVQKTDLGPLGNIVAAVFLIIFAHTGWERIGYSAGEMKNPRRVIPLSLFVGISIVVILYALTNTVYHRTLGMEGVRQTDTVASDALTVLIGPIGAAVIAVLAIISTSGSINGTMMTAPRVYYAMAKDRLFFKWLDHIHPRFQTPSRAIVVHCLWAGVILIIRGSFGDIAKGLVFTILIFFGLSTLAIFKMRRENIGGKDIFKVPLYPFLPVLFLSIIVVLIVLRGIFEWKQSLIDLSFIVTGIPFAIYWCRCRQHLIAK